MNLFTTRQLLGYTEQKVKFNPLFLTLFFRRTVTFKEQEVMLDKITGKPPLRPMCRRWWAEKCCVIVAVKPAYCARDTSNRSMR